MITALFSALNKILFDNMEVISMSLLLRPQLCDRDTLRFIDKLRFNNQELENGGSIPKADMFDTDEPFIPDDLMIEEEDTIDFDDDGNVVGTLPDEDQCEQNEEQNDDEDFGENEQ